MLSAYINAIGVLAPGLDNWQTFLRVVQNPQTYQAQAVEKKLALFLPANERRRVSRVTLLALAVAQQLGEIAELGQALQVFSMCNSDISTFDQISRALAMPDRPVSPIRFHNSVHNSGAGYWSIASQSQEASTSLCGGVETFALSFLDAMVQLNASDNTQQRDCVLVCYDEVAPKPFQPFIRQRDELASALKLSMGQTGAMARIELSLYAKGKMEAPPLALPKGLVDLYNNNEQASSLLLLYALAQLQLSSEPRTLVLPCLEQELYIQLFPVQTVNSTSDC